MMLLLVIAGRGHGQSFTSLDADHFPIRIRSEGNELLALRAAPVAYTTLEQLASETIRPSVTHLAPIRLLRASPPQVIDYLLCVTREGTLIIGEQVHALDLGQDRYVFTRGGIVRAYPQVDHAGFWLWLVEIPLSREVRVTLELRTIPKWPVESVTITASRMP
jgi:hypothetical protein